MVENGTMQGTLSVIDRRCVKLDGVNNIEGFDDTYIALSTSLGRVVIEGKDLKVESLTKDDGKIHISGHVNGIYYSEQKTSKNILNRIFG